MKNAKKTNDRYKEEENVLASEGHSKHQIQIHIQQHTKTKSACLCASKSPPLQAPTPAACPAHRGCFLWLA